MTSAAAPRLGIGLPLEGRLDALLDIAAEAEALGYATLWANDDRLQYDMFSVLAAIALRTARLRLGPGVTNPYTRHPALIASGIATLDALSNGRAVLGLGAGGTNHRMLGIDRVAPAAALREAVTVIRGLLASQHVTLEGRVVCAHDAHLDVDPLRHDVPIHIGTRGPRVLELAGEVADGVIVGNVATAEGWHYATTHIAAGAARAGRSLEDVELTAWLYACVDDDPATAVDALRPMAATSLVTSRAILGELGVRPPAAFTAEMERRGFDLGRAAVTAAGALLPAELVTRFGIAGTVEQCGAQLRALLGAVPQLAEVVIVPFGDVAQTIRRFAREVVPQALPVGAWGSGR